MCSQRNKRGLSMGFHKSRIQSTVRDLAVRVWRVTCRFAMGFLACGATHGQLPQPSPFIEKLPPVTDDAALEEPDYAEVAADARKIADEIETRLIEAHMEEASGNLTAHKAPEGYSKAEEAYLDMKEMIKFVESAGGNAGSACKFKLEIKMGMNMGDTLGQMKMGMKPGTSGLNGMTGQGSSGQSGGGQNFGMFGPESFGDKSNAKSRLLGDRKAKSDA